MSDRVEFFLGLGQDKKCKRWLEERLPSAIHIHEAPNYFAAENDSIRMKRGLAWVGERIASDAERYVLCAESQAAPAAVIAVERGIIPAPTAVVLILPLGCNYQSLGDTPTSRYKELLKRSKQFWSHKNQSLKIWGNRITAINVAIDSIKHFSELERAYTFGANQDITRSLSSIAKTIPVTIFAAIDDTLFPFHEIEQNFKDTKVIVKRIDGTHLNRATPAGLAQLNSIFALSSSAPIRR